MQEFGLYLNIGTLVTLASAVGGGVWWLSRIEKGVRDDMDAQIDNVQRDIQNVERSVVDRTESIRHEFGETASAIRQKIHETETWNRDTFVRKDSFELVIGRLEKSIEKLGDRLEAKIDRAAERIEHRQP